MLGVEEDIATGVDSARAYLQSFVNTALLETYKKLCNLAQGILKGNGSKLHGEIFARMVNFARVTVLLAGSILHS